MGKVIKNEELIGKTFGKLKVLSIGKNVNGNQYFNCICSCDNNTIVEKTKKDLVAGKRLACKKCLIKENYQNKVSDILNKKVGRLTIESINRKDQKNLQYYYNCRCECNRITVKPRRVLLDALKNPNTKIQCEYCDFADYDNNIVGNTYGDITIIAFDHKNEYGARYYKCRCKNGHDLVRERNSIINQTCKCDLCFEESKYSDSNPAKLIDRKVGKLEILSMFRDANNQICYTCKCECNNIIIRSREYFLQIKRENENKPKDQRKIAMCDECRKKERLQKQINECIGKIYGYLHVDSFAELKDIVSRPGEHEIVYNCTCTRCGNKCTAVKRNLKSGLVVSCGCYNRDKLKEVNTKHGMYDDPFYQCYHDMKSRCLNSNHQSYSHYGERGITIDPRWLGENGFLNFKADMYESYLEFKKWYPNDTSLDRIDNNGNYCKENCRWTTMKVQNNNQSTTVHVNYNGQDYLLSEFHEKFCPELLHATLYKRLENGGFINSDNNKMINDYNIGDLVTLRDKRFPKNAFKPL